VDGFLFFIAAYSVASFATIFIAPKFGRQAVPCFVVQTANLKTAHPLYCILNRNYVTADLALLLTSVADAVAQKFDGTRTLVLDGNFPFLKGFPLLPHLSHDDGRKVDISFYYQYQGNYLRGGMKSPIGYWGYTQPSAGEDLPCDASNNALSLRWGFDFLQGLWPKHEIEPQRTAYLLNWLANEGLEYGVEKILLEPHLKTRLALQNNIIRFQGCQAARHDDHIHLQIR